jgi:hypothetical protein
MEEKREQAEFNDAFGFLKQISDDFKRADMFSQMLDAYGWSNTLFALSRSLSTYMKKEEEEYFIRERTTIKMMLYQHSRNRKAHLSNNIPEELYDVLDLYERKLWKIFADSGLMMKKVEDAMRALR